MIILFARKYLMIPGILNSAFYMTSRTDAATLDFIIIYSTTHLRVQTQNEKTFDRTMLASQEFSWHSIPRILRALHSRRAKFARIYAMASRAAVLNARKSIAERRSDQNVNVITL